MQIVPYVTNSDQRMVHVVPARQEARSPFDLNVNSELHLPHSAAAISPLRRAVMEDCIDPSKSESSTQLNASSVSWLTNGLVEFPPLSSENLIRLGEDLLHACPIHTRVRDTPQSNKYLSSISALISRGKTSPTGLSSEEATALAEIFHKVSLPHQIPSQRLTPLVVRPYPDGGLRVIIRTRGPDFSSTPSSVDHEYSPAWKCPITPRTTLLMDLQTSGRENTMGNQCALRWLGDIRRTN